MTLPAALCQSRGADGATPSIASHVPCGRRPHHGRGLYDPPMPPIRSGQPAAPFRLIDTAGREHTLDAYRGHWVLLVLHRHLA